MALRRQDESDLRLLDVVANEEHKDRQLRPLIRGGSGRASPRRPIRASVPIPLGCQRRPIVLMAAW
jgi:hypothetical protein